MPQTGQPLTVYYFKDQNGTNVLYTFDIGGAGGDSGGSGGG